MSSLYANTGCDLDLILYKGTGPGSIYIYDDTGTDLGQKYSSGSVGYDLGFAAPSGQDIGRILGGDVLAVWRSNLTDASDGASDPISDAWHLVTLFSSDKSKWNKITQDTEAYTLGRHKKSAGSLFNQHERGYRAVAYHLMVNATNSDMEITLGAPSSTDGNVWIDEIRSPNAYTKNFVVVGYGGVNERKWYEDGYTDEHDDWVAGQWHTEMVMSSISLYVNLKIGGLTTKSYAAKLSF